MWQFEILVSVIFLILESGALIILLYDRKTVWWMAALTVPIFTLLMTPFGLFVKDIEKSFPHFFVDRSFSSSRMTLSLMRSVLVWLK